jgi:hypothetical protein
MPQNQMVPQKINGHIQNACIGMETPVQLEEGFKTYDWFFGAILTDFKQVKM